MEIYKNKHERERLRGKKKYLLNNFFISQIREKDNFDMLTKKKNDRSNFFFYHRQYIFTFSNNGNQYNAKILL